MVAISKFVERIDFGMQIYHRSDLHLAFSNSQIKGNRILCYMFVFCTYLNMRMDYKTNKIKCILRFIYWQFLKF